MFVDRGIPDGERTRYRAEIGGRRVGDGSLVVRAEGGSRYRQTFEGSVSGQPLSYRSEVVFGRSGESLYPISSSFETLAEGERVAFEEGRFPGVQALTFGGEVGVYPAEMVPWFGVPLALRGAPQEPGARFSFPIWLANTVYWDLAGRVAGRELIVVPAGAYEAWRVTLRISLLAISPPIDRLARAAIRPFRFHFDVAWPHRLLRFDFPTGPFPWNPRGMIEAVEVT